MAAPLARRPCECQRAAPKRPRHDDIPFDVVAFDLTAALNHALERLGRPEVEPSSVRYLVGHGARALLAPLFRSSRA